MRSGGVSSGQNLGRKSRDNLSTRRHPGTRKVGPSRLSYRHPRRGFLIISAALLADHRSQNEDAFFAAFHEAGHHAAPSVYSEEGP
jgi:hypothetical protein